MSLFVLFCKVPIVVQPKLSKDLTNLKNIKDIGKQNGIFTLWLNFSSSLALYAASLLSGRIKKSYIIKVVRKHGHLCSPALPFIIFLSLQIAVARSDAVRCVE